jgi:proteasome lid subunit RPN8/RPN11
MRVVIDKQIWREIKKQAIKSFPNECVGFYIGFKIPNQDVVKISTLYPCRNISEDKKIRSIVSRKQIKRVAKECANVNKIINIFFVGQYHSHPTTGGTIQSATDRSAGRKLVEYRHQLILGIKEKLESRIKKRFYYLDKDRQWKEGKIVVKN